MTIDPQKIYYATFKSERGDIRVQLFADRAPQTVNNFVFLAREGFYNDTVFHRVLDGFMAQGGDPTGTGMGGPGYTFGDEFNPSLTFDRPGLLAMANSGPSTNGSQFFITFAPTEWLNNLHTIFGEVVSGQDVLD
ncbi:MAG TPA: peptidylprolyl isomerase, partial [Caldilineaceae bacterium]|nr:peptidylprolyl isomerase [Caldilineaceae bacterium]